MGGKGITGVQRRWGGVSRGVDRGQVTGFEAAEEKVRLIKKRNGDNENKRSQVSQVGRYQISQKGLGSPDMPLVNVASS